jgi:hypothetical protein
MYQIKILLLKLIPPVSYYLFHVATRKHKTAWMARWPARV